MSSHLTDGTGLCPSFLPCLQATMPVERMRMRPWLEEQINSCLIPGLKWVNRVREHSTVDKHPCTQAKTHKQTCCLAFSLQEKRIFQIPWMHAARHGWDLEKDAPLFMNWAIHTGSHSHSDIQNHTGAYKPVQDQVYLQQVQNPFNLSPMS